MDRTAKYALVAGSVLPSGELPRGQKVVTVATPLETRKLAASMAAAAGLHATLVQDGAPSELVLLREGTSDAPQRPAAVKYDAKVLAALVPGAKVSVGSLRQLMPAVTWLTDPGGMVVDVPVRDRLPDPVAAPTDAPRQPYGRATGSVTLAVSKLPKPPLGVRGPVLRVALDEPRVRGVPVKEGDVIVDQTGARWFVRDGVLWSHKTATYSRDDLIVEGRVLRPARAGTPLLGAGVGDKIEVLMLGLDSSTVYGTVVDDDEHAWKIMLDVNRSIVSDPRATCFGARLAATAAECYAAGGVWDRPCESDVECPFYDSRTGRGKCVSGTCEMPLGVGNKSFRVADPATPALCDTDSDDPWCP